MSFAIDFAGDARTDWRELDVELQEAVLDELDALAAAISPAGAGVTYRHHFYHQIAGTRRHVRLRFVIDLPRSTIILLGVNVRTAASN